MRLNVHSDGQFPEQETGTLPSVDGENRTFDLQLVARRQQFTYSNLECLLWHRI